MVTKTRNGGTLLAPQAVERETVASTLRVVLERVRLGRERLDIVDGTTIALRATEATLHLGEVDAWSRRATLSSYDQVVAAYEERFAHPPRFDRAAYDDFVRAVTNVLRGFSFETDCSASRALRVSPPEAASTLRTNIAATVVASVLLLALIARMVID